MACSGKAVGELLVRRHIASEPVDSSVEYIAAIFRVRETVALIRVDNQLRRNMEIAQRVPEFEGLRCWTFPIAVAHESEGGSICLFDECDRGTFCINRGIVINRRPE